MPIPARGHPPHDNVNTDPPPSSGELPPLELRILAGPGPGHRDLRTWLGGIVGVFILSWLWAPHLRDGPVYSAAAAQDFLPALRLYYERALAGDAGAMRVLGDMYCEGLNVPRNKAEGLRWLRRAAAAGNADAAMELERLEPTR